MLMFVMERIREASEQIFTIEKLKMKRVKKSLSLIVMFLFLCCLSLTVKAQFSFGIEGGYNKNYLYTNASNLAFTTYDPVSGFSVGVPLQYTFSEWFSVMADPNYIQKNYQVSRSGYFRGIYHTNTNGYIQ